MALSFKYLLLWDLKHKIVFSTIKKKKKQESQFVHPIFKKLLVFSDLVKLPKFN